MNPEGLETVDINFEDPSLPAFVQMLRPLVWHDENLFCVLLGPSPTEGVFGCGATIIAALEDWNTHVKERLTNINADDEVTRYLRDTLNASLYKIN